MPPGWGNDNFRGTGWLRLEKPEIVHLKGTQRNIDRWPDSSRAEGEILKELLREKETVTGEELAQFLGARPQAEAA